MVQSLQSKLRGDTGRLAGTYLAIIMALTIVFSFVIYSISSSQLNRPISPRAFNGGSGYQFDAEARMGLRELFEQRANEARAELFLSLVLLNVVVAAGGAFLSYFLARKTLEPIETAMRSQAQFVSDASHELRTPLTALQVTNEVALRKKKLSVGDAKEVIEHNLAETTKLRNLSEALLGLAKQDNADTSKAKLSLALLVRSIVESLQPLADEKSITIDWSGATGSAVANQSAIEQILRILIDNAIKYSPHDSVVTISTTTDQTGTTVAVTDNGPGIAHQQHERIFDRFYRVDESRSSQNVQGSGLGLSIAYAIAERHGYGLSVESELGQGATFTVFIP